MKVLVINSGSSSLKYQLIDMETEGVIAKGTCERIGIEGSKLTHKAKGVETVLKTVDYTTVPPLTVEGTVLLPFGGIFTATLAALPTVLLFVSLGILFGTLLNEKSAPGISSAVITASGLLGGAWMPLSDMGSFADFCSFLPFYPATTLARTAFMLHAPTASGFWLPLITVTLWCVAVFTAAVLLFLRSLRGEK